MTFTVAGPPVPKARPRVVKGHAFTDPRTTAAEQAIRWTAKAAGVPRLDGPVALTLRFFEADKRRRDADNLAKLCLDALNGVAWLDDSQVVDLHVFRRLDRDKPRTVITIEGCPKETS